MNGLNLKSDSDSLETKLPLSIRKKRRLHELQEQFRSGQLSNNEDESDDDSLLGDRNLDMIPKPSSKKLKYTTEQKRNTTTTAVNSDIGQYKLAKAQLKYILRENEMLMDEWKDTKKKLKRLRTERRVLLDALVKDKTKSTSDQDED